MDNEDKGGNMNRDADDELHDIMEEVSEDLGHSPDGENDWRRRPASYQRPMSKGLFILMGGVGVLLVIVLFLLIFSGEKGGKADERLSVIQARVDKIEKQVGSLAGAEERVVQAEKQAKLAQQSLAGADRQLSVLEGKIEDLARKVEALQRKESAPVAQAEPKKKQQEKSSAQTNERHHVVKPGETLYQIAKKYGTTIEELRRLNQLKPGQALHPGQKLVVSK
jgi:LysM repeat protein